MSRNQHVVPYGGHWAVRKEGNTRITSVYKTKRDAISAARKFASSGASELVIHGRNGKVLEKDTYGQEPILARYRFAI